MKFYLIIKKIPLSLFFIIIFFILIISIKGENNNMYSCKITIKINSSGRQKFLSSAFENYPNFIIVNNNNRTTNMNSNILNLHELSNTIELFWNNDLTNCEKIFYGCENITEVDLSEFNGTNVNEYNNMFEDCISLTSINISNLDTSSAKNMSYMFFNCLNITSLDLSSFNTHLVTNMSSMFSGCESLKFLNISNFDTSKVINMTKMFNDCRSLESLDLSNFYTPSLINMNFIFAECENLTYINLNNFNTSNVVEMKRVFSNCKSLTYLNLSSFNTSKVDHMVSMFNGCEKLVSLDLSSFDTKIVRNMNSMFAGCKSITSLNLSHFITSSLNNIEFMFHFNRNLTYLDLSNFDTSNIKNMTSLFSYCKSLKSIDLSHFNTSSVKSMMQMFQNCASLEYLNLSNFDTSLVTDMTNMFQNCENLKYINLKNSNDSNLIQYSDIFKNTPEKMIFCIDENKNKKLYDIIINNKTNSIINCSNDAYIYTPEIIYPAIFPTIIMESINNNFSFNISCLLENINNNEELYSLIVNNILKRFSNNEEQVIEGKDNIIYQITNNKNQLNILKNKTLINEQNLTIIDFENCENILKKEYNINQNDSLIILKQENLSTNIKSSEKNVQYEVFEPYNKTKLNLSLCEGTTINIYTKIIFSEKNKKIYQRLKELGYDMFNINNKFYQDICTPYKTENNTDILLSDRYDYIYNNDDTQCQKNCKFSEYLLDTQYMHCECSSDVKNINNKKDKFDAKKIYESFYEVLKHSNYQVFKCYKLVFDKKIYSKNIGGIIIFSYFCIIIVCLIFYLFKKDRSLKNKIFNLQKDNKINKIKKNDNDIFNNKIKLVKKRKNNYFPPKKQKKKY